jgi:hypothetical protein
MNIGQSRASKRPNRRKSDVRDLNADADEALAVARSMPNGPQRVEALKRAGLLRRAADADGIAFAKLGRPRK